MKGKEQAPLSFSRSPLTPDTQEPSAQQPRQSPYLKAILTGSIERTGQVVRMVVSDKLAAIRYIQESKWRNKFCRV